MTNEQLKKQRNELLAALGDCLEIIEAEYDNDPEPEDLPSWKRVIEAAREAIAKATSDNHIVDYSHLAEPQEDEDLDDDGIPMPRDLPYPEAGLPEHTD